MPALDRINEFEGIRGILSVIVVVGHLGLIYGHDWIPWFWGAMEVFFALSGYLITRMLIGRVHENGVLGRYYIRRLLRIWPLYYIVLLATCGLDMMLSRAAGQTNGLGYGVVKSAFFLQNVEHYLGGVVDPSRSGYPIYFSHSWSVAVEEHFYLLVPAILLVANVLAIDWRLPRPRICLIVATVGMALSLYFRLDDGSVIIFPGRADGFLLGSLLAIHCFSRNDASSVGERRFFLWLLGLGILGMLSVAGVYYACHIAGFDDSLPSKRIRAIGLPAFAIFGAALIKICIDNAGSGHLRLLRNPFMVHLGRISYSTYLWHIPLVIVLGGIFRKSGNLPISEYIKLPMILILILILSHFSYRMIEQPALKLKRRFDG